MEKKDYLKIRINSIHPDFPIPFDLFININDKQIHYLRAGDSLQAKKIQSFESAPNQFFIRNDDKKTYKDYIRDCLDSEHLEIKEKAILLRESSLSLVEELFESPDVRQALVGSKEVIENFVEFMDRDAQAISHLIILSTHDFYTYNHSLDVGIYSLGLGQALGYRGDELQELGEGSLLHDIGKRQVSVDIICKKGPLDDTEWMQMRKHPDYGLQILDAQGVSDAIKACSFEHHESMLGNGYPQELEGHEIHPMAKIIAITDTYDALTTQRSYNQPKMPVEALGFMKEKLAKRYDEEFLKVMYSVLFKMKQDTSL